MNKSKAYYFRVFGYSFLGCIICIYFFLSICKFIAELLGCDYAIVALSLYLIIFVIIGCILKIVKADIRTETYYKNNFTPSKAILLVAILMFFHINLINATIELDEDGKILNLCNEIFSKKTSNNMKELKNETNTQTENNNDFSSDTDDDRMRYRD